MRKCRDTYEITYEAQEKKSPGHSEIAHKNGSEGRGGNGRTYWMEYQ